MLIINIPPCQLLEKNDGSEQTQAIVISDDEPEMNGEVKENGEYEEDEEDMDEDMGEDEEEDHDFESDSDDSDLEEDLNKSLKGIFIPFS